MSIGWFKKWRIESTTKEIIRGIIQEVETILRNNPGLTLEESLRLVDKQRNMFFPDEENIKSDLYSLFGMMVYKAYRCNRASDMDSCGQEHAKLVLQIAYDYLNMVCSKTSSDFKKLESEATNYTKMETRSRDRVTGCVVKSSSGFSERGMDALIDIYTDQQTGLMWTRNGNITGEYMTWEKAMAWVKSLEYCGYCDWRLPTIEEFKTFAKQGGVQPYRWFNTNKFNGVEASWYWSSSADCENGASCLDMLDGIVYTREKTYDYYVWPVRSGQ